MLIYFEMESSTMVFYLFSTDLADLLTLCYVAIQH